MKPRRTIDCYEHEEAQRAASDGRPARYGAYPDLSLEDVKAGRVPEPMAKELKRRQEVLRIAHDIRPKLNISPLTTWAVVRDLRDGIESHE